jgi:hypothetical protein
MGFLTERFGSALFFTVLFVATRFFLLRDEQLRARILDAILEGCRGKAAEHDRVDRANARTRVHGDHNLGNERHIDHDAVAETHALVLQGIGAAAYLSVQFTIAQTPAIAGLAFKNKRRLMAALGKMHIQTVVGNIQTPVGEPAVIGSV